MKKAILVVSFGTTYENALKSAIESVENTIRKSFPMYEVRRAFTSGMIIRSLKKSRIIIDTVDEALDKLVSDGYDDIIIQPTHIIDGEEFDKMCEVAEKYKDSISIFKIGMPLLKTQEDIKTVCSFINKLFPEKDEAVVLMGHGSEHSANKVYSDFDNMCQKLGYYNIFVGTVEAEPTIYDVINKLKSSNYKKVIITPLMLVAGDHAHNDMAGAGPDSWKSTLEKAGFKVQALIKGLGEYSEIHSIIVEHLNQTIGGLA